MSKTTTIKVSKSTLERLHRLVGELAKQRGKRITLEEAIIHMLEKNELLDKKTEQAEIEKDRKSFLSLIEQKFFGAKPEDFKEYDYDDIGG